MQPRALQKSAAVVSAALALIATGARPSLAADYEQTDLVSNIPGLASLTDTELQNSWGVSESATSPFWISDQGTGVTTLYSVTNATAVSKVDINPPNGFVGIPATTGGGQGPTGQVSNSNSASFDVGDGGNGSAAHFIFASLNGTIAAWDTGANAFVQATTAGASYTGLAINTAQTRLYAANDAGTGSIDVFNSAFVPVNLGVTAFVDPNLPAGLVPFNVQDIAGKVYVTYAPAGHSNQTDATQGVVDVFDENGVFQQRLITNGPLAAPWGVALAPAGFGEFGGDLLVGNFSFDASEINAFDPDTGAFEGTIPVDPGAGNTPGGLWDLTFGNGGNGGDPNTLYFADGINGEADGLFAAVQAVPEPSSLALFGAACAALGLRFRKRAG